MATSPGRGATPTPDPKSATEAFQGATASPNVPNPPGPSAASSDDRMDRFLARFDERMDQLADAFGSRIERLEQLAAKQVAATATQPSDVRRAPRAAPAPDPTPWMDSRPSFGALTPQQMTGMVGPVDDEPNSLWSDDGMSVREISKEEARRLKAVNERLVAFIPKDDQLNPRNKSFDTWVNGRRIRIMRGEVGMMALGHAIQLARGGHGHVVDISAIHQGAIPIERYPDLADEDSSGPVVPPEVVARY